ncbi:MAG: YicC family protein [Deltaproteobacteria bacterium]|nr:YicC family protein [Deltaproteobacteria bacterium]
MPGKIKSMTAFGRSSFVYEGTPYGVELRTTNNRFLDIRLHLPGSLPEFENEVVHMIRSKLYRGRVELVIKEGGGVDTGDLGEELLATELKRVCDFLGRVRKELDIDDQITISDVLKAYELVASGSMPIANPIEFRKTALQGISEVFDALLKMRANEGTAMDRSMVESIEAINVLVQSIETLARDVPKTIKQKLEERLESLTKGKDEVDPIRVAQEIAMLADKADITEELVRIHSHMDQFRQTRNAQAPHGRKLEFLLQEIHRETNTVGAKTPDVRIARAAVEIKTEIEKMRELVRNVE